MYTLLIYLFAEPLIGSAKLSLNCQIEIFKAYLLAREPKVH